MKKLLIAACVSALGCAIATTAWPAPHTAPHTVSALWSRADQLRSTMRLLWADHVSYTRNVVISMIADLPDQQEVTARLLRNQDDIGNAIKPFYGEEAGARLSSLLRDHILIAASVVTAAKSNDATALSEAQRKWSENAKELAALLGGANPNWSKADLEVMLQAHLDLLTDQVSARLHKDWPADVAAYDKGELHMMMFADELADGLVKQFPQRFVD